MLREEFVGQATNRTLHGINLEFFVLPAIAEGSGATKRLAQFRADSDPIVLNRSANSAK